MRTKIPSHLIAGLAWEESHVRDYVKPHKEEDGSCSFGILQKNGRCGSKRDPEKDLKDALSIAEYWWGKTGHNWELTKRGFRAGHL